MKKAIGLLVILMVSLEQGGYARSPAPCTPGDRHAGEPTTGPPKGSVPRAGNAFSSGGPLISVSREEYPGIPRPRDRRASSALPLPGVYDLPPPAPNRYPVFPLPDNPDQTSMPLPPGNPAEPVPELPPYDRPGRQPAPAPLNPAPLPSPAVTPPAGRPPPLTPRELRGEESPYGGARSEPLETGGAPYSDDRRAFKRESRAKVRDFLERMAVLERMARRTPESFRRRINRRLAVLRCQCDLLAGQVNSVESAPRELWGLLQREINGSIRRIESSLTEREAGMRIEPGRERFR